MKKKPTKPQPSIVARCSDQRISHLSNDLSENIASGSIEEWRAVALYFRNRMDIALRDLRAIRFHLSMKNVADAQIKKWCKAQRNNNSRAI